MQLKLKYKFIEIGQDQLANEDVLFTLTEMDDSLSQPTREAEAQSFSATENTWVVWAVQWLWYVLITWKNSKA